MMPSKLYRLFRQWRHENNI